MRISGNAIDRLIARIIPVSLALVLLIFSITPISKSFEEVYPLLFLVMLVFLGFDILVLYSKKIVTVSINKGVLNVGNDEVNPSDILSITPRKDVRIGVNIKTIELEYLKDNLLKKSRFMPKPKLLDPLGFGSWSVDLLLKEYPQLEKVLMSETEN